MKLSTKSLILAAGIIGISLASPCSHATLTPMFSTTIEALAATTFSDYWFQDAHGNWKIHDANGTIITNAWLCDDAVPANGQNVWYLLDTNGNMISAGLVQDKTGNYYSLETSHNGYFGMLRYFSGNYDGIDLMLESQHNGAFAGILNADGLNALKAKYGVTTVSIDNNNCVYTSQFSAVKPLTTHSAAKSSSGGGGSSSGGGGGGSSSGGGGGSSSGGGGGSSSGSGGSSSAKSEAVKEVVKDFMDEYITDDMNDFEKEMQIIQYMVENIEYDMDNYLDDTIPADSYTAYGALVNGIAVCSGYTNAFMELAEACDLSVKKVSGTANGYNGWENHAWNKVKIDGNWYNVDVTWEDPTGSNPYKFGRLRNKYINVTDKQLAKDHKWNTQSPSCTATRYTGTVIEYYLMSGETDTNMTGDNWRKLLMYSNTSYNGNENYNLQNYGYKFDDGSNYFIGENAEEDLISYINDLTAAGKQTIFYITTKTGNTLDWLNGDWFRNHIGGDPDKWRCNYSSTSNGYQAYSYRYYENTSPLLINSDAKALLNEHLKEDSSNLISTKDEAKAYVKSIVDQSSPTCTLVYDTESPLYSKLFWAYDNDSLTDVSETARYYIVVDSKPYTICQYALTYKTLDNYLETYWDSEKANLFTNTGEELLNYLKAQTELSKLNAERKGYVILKDSEYTNLSDHIQIVKNYAKQVNPNFYNITLKVRNGSGFEHEGSSYTIVSWNIEYYLTQEEALDEYVSYYLEDDRSNLIKEDEVDKAVAYLNSSVNGAEYFSAYIIFQIGEKLDEISLEKFGKQIALRASIHSNFPNYNWFLQSFDGGYNREAYAGTYLLRFTFEESISPLSIASPTNASLTSK